MSPETQNQIAIREITSLAEMRAVEEMQRAVWGIPDLDVVPYSHLIAAVNSGGSLIGAFDDSKLVGFVYGFPSFERGQPAHHSHMLAVYPEYRNFRLGERLKRAQGEFVKQLGIAFISWTFDPLQSLNAYFNFNKLGVISDTYFVDFYGGDAPSFLHRNSTDRLWVLWDVTSARVIEKINKSNAPSETSLPQPIVECCAGDALLVADIEKGLLSERVIIEIPNDINTLQEQNTKLANAWRMATREAFTKAINAGFIVKEFYRRERDGWPYGAYLLHRKKESEI